MTAEDDRPPRRPAEDLVEQRELDLAVPGPAELRSEMAGPETSFPDPCLQRGDQRLPDRVGHVVAVGHDEVERLDLLRDEKVRPVEVALVVGVGLEAPAAHRVSTPHALTPGAPYTCVNATRGSSGTCRAPAAPRSCRTLS